MIDERGRWLTCLAMPETHEEIQALALAGHTPINHPCAMMRRSAVLQVGAYNTAMTPCEDLDLWLRLGELGRLANLKEMVLKYRIHANSVSEKQGVLQNQKAKEACEQAWRRRGIKNGKFEATAPWRPNPDRQSRYSFMLRYGWWAFKQRSAADSDDLWSQSNSPFCSRAGRLEAGCQCDRQAAPAHAPVPLPSPAAIFQPRQPIKNLPTGRSFPAMNM